MTKRDELLRDIRGMTAQYRAEIPGGRKAWPRSIRDKVLELRRSGMKASAIAEATGLKYFTVHGWVKRAPGFRELAIARAATVTVPILPAMPALSSATVTVTTRAGLKIEGLSFAQAAKSIPPGNGPNSNWLIFNLWAVNKSYALLTVMPAGETREVALGAPQNLGFCTRNQHSFNTI